MCSVKGRGENLTDEKSMNKMPNAQPRGRTLNPLVEGRKNKEEESRAVQVIQGLI
jgi:hypothetical protein